MCGQPAATSSICLLHSMAVVLSLISGMSNSSMSLSSVFLLASSITSRSSMLCTFYIVILRAFYSLLGAGGGGGGDLMIFTVEFHSTRACGSVVPHSILELKHVWFGAQKVVLIVPRVVNIAKTNIYSKVNPFRTAAPFWGRTAVPFWRLTTLHLTGLSSKRGCGSKTVLIRLRRNKAPCSILSRPTVSERLKSGRLKREPPAP